MDDLRRKQETLGALNQAKGRDVGKGWKTVVVLSVLGNLTLGGVAIYHADQLSEIRTDLDDVTVATADAIGSLDSEIADIRQDIPEVSEFDPSQIERSIEDVRSDLRFQITLVKDDVDYVISCFNESIGDSFESFSDTVEFGGTYTVYTC